MVYICVIIWLMYMYYRLKKSLHMLQQNLYDDDYRYFKWTIKNFSKIMLSFDLSQVFLIFFILFIPDKNLGIAEILFLIIYILLFLRSFGLSYKEVIKKPLVVTARIKRLIVTILLITIIPSYFLIKSGINIYLVLSFIGYFTYYIVLVACKLNIPVEKCVFLSFKRKAVNKLKNMTNLKVIGITGSYGKTSSKNILNEILNVKYNSITTKKNLNTPYGLIMTINNDLDKFDEVFIAEMGAYKIGEIKELCDLVKPKYGIITRIGKAHLELFGSQENIQKGKFELLEALPSDGVCVLNADDPLQVSYEPKNKVKRIWIGIDNDCDFRATNIKVSNKGSSFDLIIKGDKNKYKFETKLLGYANIYNILSAIALGYEFKISVNQLISAVKSVNPIEHRLELKRGNGVYYLDDAYNSNPVGAKMALDVLGMMPGYKIVVTPGMIELGSSEYKENYDFGCRIADVADEVILIGEKQTEAIKQGLESMGYDNKKIHIEEDVINAFPLINKLKRGETYVLLENDLPDIFK